MRGYRLSIAGMLATVAVVGLWFASLRTASVVWLAAAATVTLGLLLTAVLGAWLLPQGPARAFWRGFALFAWVYFVFVNWDWVGGPLGHDLTGGLRELAEFLFPPDPDVVAAGQFATTLRLPAGARMPPPGFDYFNAAQQREMKLGNFVEIGRMALSLLFGMVGGLVARSMAARGERTGRAAEVPAPASPRDPDGGPTNR
jgi:hypothetical protein